MSTRWLVLAVLIPLVGSFSVKISGVDGYPSVSDTFVLASDVMLGPEAGAVRVPNVVVRWCPQGRPVAEGGRIQALVGRLIGRAGVGLSWAGCNDRDPGALPSGPFATESVAVRLVATSPASLADDHPALGESLIEQARGILATVYIDRVERLAHDAGVDPATLLARAIAHEIGHVLLGTIGHSPRGLMRARWSVAELRRDAFADWVFSGREARGMRAGARRRANRDRLLASSVAPKP